MAKKKESIYRSWDDVDTAMKELATLNVQKQKLEGEQTVRINDVKSKIAVRAGELCTKIKQIEKEIERYSEQNKDEFLKTRNKKLKFGSISYRLTKSICCECVQTAIKALKSLNYDFCIRTKEELDKEALKELSQDVLTKIGVNVKVVDKIQIEPDYVKLINSSN